ncbi:UvrD-helicase domain-containing protein [Streptomyces phaeochromogenes]|uniref:UvrD-helicase domain-containing protein n=1 Tax=Streptomyces phaeochromogenes TaxID=1923 RepID=UPI0033F8A8ED
MTPLYAPDAFIKDKVEALAQQLGLELPHQEQWNFIQSAESLDLQAAPGSGKTSLIGLKLALLCQGWTSPTRGICVLSHTNTAKDEIAHRLATSPAGRRLLQYPHFIGTIQAFTNTFFALPALRARGIEVQIVDDRAYADEVLRLFERHPQFRKLNTARTAPLWSPRPATCVTPEI